MFGEKKGVDYTTHGSTLPGRNYISSPSYKFGYQGQEKDAETGFNNFELRQYDARLGRWFNPDPMGQYHSPYLAMGNNPISMIDPTGGESFDPDGGMSEADMKRNPYSDYMDNGYSSASEMWWRQLNTQNSFAPNLDDDERRADNQAAYDSKMHDYMKAQAEYNDYRPSSYENNPPPKPIQPDKLDYGLTDTNPCKLCGLFDKALNPFYKTGAFADRPRLIKVPNSSRKKTIWEDVTPSANTSVQGPATVIFPGTSKFKLTVEGSTNGIQITSTNPGWRWGAITTLRRNGFGNNDNQIIRPFPYNGTGSVTITIPLIIDPNSGNPGITQLHIWRPRRVPRKKIFPYMIK